MTESTSSSAHRVLRHDDTGPCSNTCRVFCLWTKPPHQTRPLPSWLRVHVLSVPPGSGVCGDLRFTSSVTEDSEQPIGWVDIQEHRGSEPVSPPCSSVTRLQTQVITFHSDNRHLLDFWKSPLACSVVNRMCGSGVTQFQVRCQRDAPTSGHNLGQDLQSDDGAFHPKQSHVSTNSCPQRLVSTR